MIRATVAALAAAVACASAALAEDTRPPITSGGGPLPPATPAVLLLPEDPATLVVRSWRSDRIGGAVRERVTFTFCSSRNLRPLRVSVTESRGWDRHAARPASTPRFVEGRRFTLRLERRYPVDVPQ